MNKEGAGGLIFLVVGIYGFIFSMQLPLGHWNEPGPRVFPMCVSILLFISGASWVIFRKGALKAGLDWRGIVKKLVMPLKITGVTAIFILSLERFGYLLASSFYLFVLFLWVCRFRLWAALGLATIIGVSSWLFFQKFLSLPLP